MAKIYEKQEHLEAALKALDEALKVVPDSGKVHAVRGQVLQRLGLTEQAKAEFATAKRLMDEGLEKDREEWGEKMVPSPELKQTPN